MSLPLSTFDPQPFLKSKAQQAAYIESALQSGDGAVIMEALRHVAQARGENTDLALFRLGNVEALADTLKILGLKLHVIAAE